MGAGGGVAARRDEEGREVPQLVVAALEEYEFFRRDKGRVLARRRKPQNGEEPTDRFECLVYGRWVPRRLSSRKLRSANWQKLEDEKESEQGRKILRRHVRRYLINPCAKVIPKSDRRGCLARSRLGRWVKPPLRGGADRGVDRDTSRRSRRDYVALLEEGKDENLARLTEEALLGYEHERARAASAEQRANFFLGAAGLTSTLVLTNAGLLFGDGKLEAPWLGLAIASLALASVCAIVAGLRAIQATMITFVRSHPAQHLDPSDGAPGLGERRPLPCLPRLSLSGAEQGGGHRRLEGGPPPRRPALVRGHDRRRLAADGDGALGRRVLSQARLSVGSGGAW